MLQQEIRDEVLETKALMLLVEKLRGKRTKTDKQIKKGTRVFANSKMADFTSVEMSSTSKVFSATVVSSNNLGPQFHFRMSV